MFVTVKMLLRSLILPPGGPLLLALLGLWLFARARSRGLRRAGLALTLAALTTLWLLSLPLVAQALWRAAQREPVLDPARIASAQAIVVLAGGRYRVAAPEYALAPAADEGLLGRLDYAAQLARRTQLPVLVSGTDPETQAMLTALARDFGVSTRWVENRSRDTFENARNSARLLHAAGVTRVLLVTDAVHEYRAAREFEAAGMGVIPAPAGLADAAPEVSAWRYVPRVDELQRSTQALYEILGEWARRAMAALHLRRQSP